MLKTLRITSIVLVVCGAVLVIMSAVYGVRRDESIERFLEQPGVVEEFKKQKRDKPEPSRKKDPPLVEQAKKFALFLDPPKPKPPKTNSSKKRKTVSGKPATVSTKFKLIGTCLYKSQPELSLTLVDLPGKGMQWVRRGSKVGHSVIDEIEDGSVVVKDAKGTYSITAQRKASYLMNEKQNFSP